MNLYIVQSKLHIPKCISVPDAWWREPVEAGVAHFRCPYFIYYIYLFILFLPLSRFLWAKNGARCL